MTIPKPKVFWPLVINSSNNKLDFRELGDVADRTATIASGTYYSIDTLLAAVKTAMDAASLASDPWTIAVNDATGEITFTAAGGTSFSFRFGTGTNVASSPYLLLGFYALDTNSTGLTLTSPKQHLNGWYSQVAVQTDTREVFEAPNDVVTLSVAGNAKHISEVELIWREVRFHFLAPAYTFIADEGSANYGRAIENWWRTGRGRFRYWPDGTVEATYGDYFLDQEVVAGGFVPERMFTGKELYRLPPWKMRKVV